MVTRKTRSLFDRAMEKIDATGPCWLWTGAKYRNGYGAINRGQHEGTEAAHRTVWMLLVGPIPTGHDLDHVCRIRHCVNPDHLEPVTRQVNVDRGARRKGLLRHTHCVNGHEFTPENTKSGSNGSRACRACAIERTRAWRERKVAA